MFQVEITYIDDKWRLIDSATGMIAVSERNGKVLDGGGHGDDKEKAIRQAEHINASIKRKIEEKREADGGGLQDA